MPDEWDGNGRPMPSQLFGRWTFLIWPARSLRFWEDWDPLDTLGLTCTAAEDISPVWWQTDPP